MPAQQPRALQRHGRRDLYAETWGLTIDHELPAHFLFSEAYLGSRGVRLFSRGGVNFCTTAPQWNGRFRKHQLHSRAGPILSRRRPLRVGGLQVRHRLQYLQRSSVDPRAALHERLIVPGPLHLVPFHQRRIGRGRRIERPGKCELPACDKGPSVFDVRNNVTMNAVYELPFGPGKPFLNSSGVLGRIFGGWQLSSIGMWHTGHPLTIT